MHATIDTNADGKKTASTTPETISILESQKIILEQYKLFVGSAIQISEQRSKANAFYITLHSALYGAMWGVLLREWSSLKSATPTGLLLLTIPFAFLVVICVCWWFNIRSYDQLNGKKFLIVGQLEQKLPVQPWSDEWVLLERGKNWRVYWPLSRLERWIPTVMAMCDLGTVILIVMMLQRTADLATTR